MAIWELALLMFAATYLVVNTLYMVWMMKFVSKFDGIINKSAKYTEKMFDKVIKDLEDDDL